MKKIFFLLIGLVIFVFAAGAWYVNSNKESIIEMITTAVQAETGQPLVLATLPSLSFFPLGLTIPEASWGTKDAPLFVAVKNVTVSAHFSDIITGNLQISVVDIQNLTLAINDTASTPAQKTQGQSETPSKNTPLKDVIAKMATRISTLPVEEIHVRDANISLNAKGKTLATIQTLSLNFAKTGVSQATIKEQSVTWPKIVLTMNAQAVSYGAWEGRTLTARLHGEAGKYTLDRCNLNIYGGTSTNQVDIDLQELSPILKLTSDNTNINLALLPKKVIPFPLEGTITKTVKLTTRGNNEKALRQNLEGHINILGKDITARFNNKFIPMLESTFPEAKANIVFKKGIGTFTDTQIQGEGIRATTTGTINVPTENVNIITQIKLAGLTLPFFVKGPFASLRYGFEAPKILPKEIPEELQRKALEKGIKALDSLIRKL